MVDKNNEKLFNFKINAGGVTPIGEVNGGLEVNKDLNSELKIVKQLEFNVDSKPINPNYFYDESKFYYLCRITTNNRIRRYVFSNNRTRSNNCTIVYFNT